MVHNRNLYSDVAILLVFSFSPHRYQAWWNYVWYLSTATHHWHPMEMCWMHKLRLVHSLLSWGQTSLEASFLQNYHTRKWKVKCSFFPHEIKRVQLVVANVKLQIWLLKLGLDKIAAWDVESVTGSASLWETVVGTDLWRLENMEIL